MDFPHQKDIVWLNFDPALGFEIKKRRPALVISNNGYNERTHMCVVLPITTTKEIEGPFISISSNNISGFVNTLQVRSMNYSNRNFEVVDHIDSAKFYSIMERYKTNVL
ncbi:type II toxin-antitoxin system PemK/MazF family toxin [Pediococcus argentinicus]|uniref:type II toxin-antitoxin system PemK/MazF family toxin n=1 Tax=Pediococcus argentinicus TaxID=480391 RepID=UPI00070CDC45|nr:type II toxin-antitoxin system PemK/MazF family toxin [Pediococcus argentinicus]NKZ21767.1 type II toxin-antitoxin system PemK/MazF family toxin [Pediococcus argentinicus]GEP18975.1 transcriptional regulator [Pediococcus argentinicus]